jgi:ribosomal protein S27AE
MAIPQFSTEEKKAARAAVILALGRKQLRRPPVCSECGVACVAQAHHDDYSKPLAVRWLCRSCHWHTDRDIHMAGQERRRQTIEILQRPSPKGFYTRTCPTCDLPVSTASAWDVWKCARCKTVMRRDGLTVSG